MDSPTALMKQSQDAADQGSCQQHAAEDQQEAEKFASAWS